MEPISSSPENAGLLPGPRIPETIGSADADREIVMALDGYFREADENRKGGMNPRDAKWTQNLDLYWNRYDFSTKAKWQAKEVMPEVPAFVDRFAAALKEALVATYDSWYDVHDPADVEHDMTRAIKRMTDIWLSTIGRNQMGTLVSFPAVFEEQMKQGALMAASGVVLWKNDVPGGRVAFEGVDPRAVWFDHTYRNLYRIRQTEIDRADLSDMIRAKDAKGNPIFRAEGLDALTASLYADLLREREETSGHGQQISTPRKPIILKEYIATVVAPDGTKLADRALIVTANDQYIIRGPEGNPYWHGKDWLVYAPLVSAPFSVYGRSYMEDFGSLAKTYTELTNLIFDAVHTSALKAFAIVPSMLEDPNQLAGGITPNKMFRLEDGYRAEDFAKQLDLGGLDASSVQVWQALKNSLSEAAGMNEIGLGQFAPNSRTSATEVNATQQSSSAIVRSVAQTIETRFLNPLLDLVWKTGLQKARPDDAALRAAAGDQMYEALLQSRKELIKRPITFQSRGISALIQKQQMLQALMQLLQIVATNENLLAAFMQRVDPQKLLDLMFRLTNVDPMQLALSDRERLVQQTIQSLQQGGAGGVATPAGLDAMGGAAQAMGVERSA